MDEQSGDDMGRRGSGSIQTIPGGQRKCSVVPSHGHRIDLIEIVGYEPVDGSFARKVIFKQEAPTLEQALKIKRDIIMGGVLNYKNKQKENFALSIIGYSYNDDGTCKEYKLQSDNSWVPLLN